MVEKILVKASLALALCACLFLQEGPAFASGKGGGPQSSDFTVFAQYLKNPKMPAPVGIGAYGFYYNRTGVLQPLEIHTNRELAVAQINSLAAYDPDSQQGFRDGANLQFNSILLVRTANSTQAIWLQDTARFNSLGLAVNTPHNNIWNITSQDASITASGAGSLAPSEGRAIYEYVGPTKPYTLPLAIKLGVEVRQVPEGVMVYFYNAPFGGGIYDRVLLPIKGVVSAQLAVAPASIGGMSVDSELVWGGYCCGYEGVFRHMDSYLSMYYANGTGQLVPFPAFFTFGTQTAETAYNLRVLPSPSGGHVVTGQNNNTFLDQLDSIAPPPAEGQFYELEKKVGSVIPGAQPRFVEVPAKALLVPSWFKNNARWWAEGSMNDADFAGGVRYLVQSGIIKAPGIGQDISVMHPPQWARTIAGWWAEGKVSDSEFLKVLQYMAGNGTGLAP